MTANRPDQDEFDPSLEEGTGDFPYEEEPFNEGDPSEESWDKGFEEDGDVADDSESSQEPQKKKSGLFNILLIGGALIVGGGFIYMKVIAPGTPAPAIVSQTHMPPPSTEPVQEVQAEVPALPPADTPDPQAVLTPVPEPVPETIAENALPDAAASSDAPSVADVVPVLSDETVQQVTPEATPEAALQTAAATPANPVPELSAIMKTESTAETGATPPMPSPISAPETVPVTDNATPAYPVTGTLRMTDIPEPVKDNVVSSPTSMSDESAKAIDEKLSLLITRLEGFEGRIASLEKGVRDISSQPVKEAATVDMSEITTAVKSLEQKMAALESKPIEKPAEKPAEAQPVFVPAPEVPDERPIVPLEEPVSQVPPETAAIAPAVEEPPVVKPRAATPKPVTAVKTTAWILRSAQPGSAMIVPKAGGEMKSVRVGDSVNGLGRIVAIEQRQGRWVVQGTTGQVAQ